MKFTVKCEMPDRWVPHFLSMLEYMEHLGQVGSSRLLTFYADGDGDFHPQFHVVDTMPRMLEMAKLLEDIEPKETRDMDPRFSDGDRFFDAG